MKTNKFYFLVLGLVFSAVAFTAIDKAAGDNGIRAAIEAGTAEWVKQYNAGNAAGVAALYTEDAKALPPNSDFVTGREAMTKLWQEMLDSGAKGIKLEAVDVTGMGDSAGEVGTYEIMDTEGKVVDKGKYIVLWKKIGSAWKIHRDIWNTSMPAAPVGENK